MAWRNYVDPTTNEVWWTDDAGNFIPDAQWQRENKPAAKTPGLLPESMIMMPASPMSMVGGLDQLASQQAILNQQYLRQRLQDLEMPQAQATLSGYMPNVWKRAQASGRYTTKNGPKTLQEMRAEIVAASKA